VFGKKMVWEYIDRNPEAITSVTNDLSKIKAHYPSWEISKSQDQHLFRDSSGAAGAMTLPSKSPCGVALSTPPPLVATVVVGNADKEY
jgi:hypothetical protein